MTAAHETEQVAVTFSYFDTELYYDYVVFYDVEYPAENAFFGDFLFPVSGYFGNYTTVFSPFKSNGQHIGVLFSSDYIMHGKGFQASFVSVKCKYLYVVIIVYINESIWMYVRYGDSQKLKLVFFRRDTHPHFVHFGNKIIPA